MDFPWFINFVMENPVGVMVAATFPMQKWSDRDTNWISFRASRNGAPKIAFNCLKKVAELWFMADITIINGGYSYSYNVL
jgi:hypothetical protein